MVNSKFLRSVSPLAIVGGLLVSQVLTLYTTPIIYLYLDRLSERLTKRKRPATRTAGGAGPVPAASKPS